MTDKDIVRKKTLLIGWDAADWKMISPLFERGLMPNLERLIKSGAHGNLSTIQPCYSPMLWTSIATGKRAYKHGVIGFTEPCPNTGYVRPVTNLSRKTKALWNIFNQTDKHSVTIGWWPSNPAEPLSKGVMVSNHYQRAETTKPDDWEMPPGTVHPERLKKALKELRFHPAELAASDLEFFIPAMAKMSREEKEELVKAPPVQSLLKIIADCTSIHSAATALIQSEPWDLFAVYYDAIDHFGHGFMKYHPPKLDYISEEEFELFQHINEAGYRYHDMMLGTLLSLAGPETDVMLISDHGFHPDEARLRYVPRESAGPAREHREYGILVAAGPSIRQGVVPYGATLLDICPTLLHNHGMAIGEDMDGRVLREILAEDNPIETIPSWDQVDGDHGQHPEEASLDAAASKDAIDQLVTLGYIADPGQDAEKAVAKTITDQKYNLAAALLDGGIVPLAATLFSELYEENPDDYRLGFKLAGCLERLRNIAQLEKLVEDLIKRRLKEGQEARERLKELSERSEKEIEEEKQRIEKLSVRNRTRFINARRNLHQKARPNLFSLQFLQAKTDYMRGRLEDVIHRTSILDEDYEGRLSAMCLRASALSRLKRDDEFEETLAEAQELNPDAHQPYTIAARHYIARKNYQAALEAADQALVRRYDLSGAHYLKGVALTSMQDLDRAEECLLNAIRLSPNGTRPYKILARISRYARRDLFKAGMYESQIKAIRAKYKSGQLGQLQEAADLIQGFGKGSDANKIPKLVAIDDPVESAGKTNSKVITVVSGLPRSGTSLMMQCLQAGGIETYTDDKRTADVSNAKGYYEHEHVLELSRKKPKRWLSQARGKAIKVVSPLLTYLPRKIRSEEDEVLELEYRIIFMERPMEDLRKSQIKMIQRNPDAKPAQESSKLERAFRNYDNSARRWAVRNKISSISIGMYDLLDDFDQTMERLTKFLGMPFNELERDAIVNDQLSHREPEPAAQD